MSHRYPKSEESHSEPLVPISNAFTLWHFFPNAVSTDNLSTHAKPAQISLKTTEGILYGCGTACGGDFLKEGSTRCGGAALKKMVKESRRRCNAGQGHVLKGVRGEVARQGREGLCRHLHVSDAHPQVGHRRGKHD